MDAVHLVNIHESLHLGIDDNKSRCIDCIGRKSFTIM